MRSAYGLADAQSSIPTSARPNWSVRIALPQLKSTTEPVIAPAWSEAMNAAAGRRERREHGSREG